MITLTKNKALFLPIATVLLAMLTAMAPMGIDTYLSSMPEMATYFGVKINQIELTLTIYFLGFAFGNFLGGPISDAFGRKALALTGISIYLLSALLIPFATNIQMVWILRAFQSLGGGFATVTPMIMIRDWFEGKKVARLATIIGMIMMFAPLFAPILGTALAHYWAWKSIFFFLAIYAALIGLALLFLIPESRPSELITNRISLREFFGKYKLLFSNKTATYILLTLGFSMAGMYAFITAGSFIYIEYFGFKPEYFPLLFGANVLLNVALSLSNNVLLRKYKTQNIIKLGVFMQLLAGVVLLFATLPEKASFIPVFIGIVWFVGSIGMIFGNGTALLLNLVPELSGSANAMIGLTRFLFGSAAGFMIAFFHTNNLSSVGIVMFTCALFANVFLLLYRRSF
jgi:DHA1 family bicyclomycin/chloramphenicol resistance-like MFS transporter